MDYGRMIVEAEAWGSTCDYSPPPQLSVSHLRRELPFGLSAFPADGHSDAISQRSQCALRDVQT